MLEVRCPQCETLFEAPESLAGKIGGCPNCNADVSIPVPASSQVIEVHAESLNGEEDATLYEDDPFFNPNAQRPPGQDQVWGRNVHIERAGGGSGCCLGGCLIIALIVFFTIYGVVSFFAG